MTFLNSLAGTTLLITPILLLLLLLTPLFDKRFAAVGRCWLWLLIVVGLCAPFTSFIPRPMLQIDVPLVEPLQQTPSQGTVMMPIPYMQTTGGITTLANHPTAANQPAAANREQDTALTPPVLANNTASSRSSFSILHMLWLAWLAGVILSAITHALAYVKFKRFVKRWSAPVEEAWVNAVFAEETAHMEVYGKVRLLCCKGIKSPVLTGFVQPLLLMPYPYRNEEELRLMIRHELTHYKRRDLWYKLALVAVRCAYWFNPVVHWMAAQANQDIETACDIKTVSGMDMGLRIRYSQLILSLAAGSPAYTCQLTTNLTGSKTILKQRFSSILGHSKRSGIALFAFLGCFIVGGTLTFGYQFTRASASAASILANEITGEITVSCYDTGNYQTLLKKAAAAFEQKYPGTKVHVQMFAAPPVETTITLDNGLKIDTWHTEDNPQEEIAYIQGLNDALTAGQGPDVIAADIIPYDRYAENGYLLDMRPLMSEDPAFAITDYRENIFDAVIYKGGQYILPINYSFAYIAYDRSLIPAQAQALLTEQDFFTYEQLLALGQDFRVNEDSPYLFGFTGGVYQDVHMFRFLLAAHYESFVDTENKKAYFDDGRFAALLSSVNTYSEQGTIKNTQVKEEWLQSNWRRIQANHAERYFYKQKEARSLLQEFTNTNTIDNGFYTPLIGHDDDDAIAGMLANANGSFPLRYNQAYAINAHSANKRVSWEFVKFLAGEEIQHSFELSHLPIHKKALEEVTKFELTNKPYNQWRSAAPITVLPPSLQETYAQYIACVQEFSEKIDTYVYRDRWISILIEQAVTDYYDGLLSADDAATLLQREVALYWNGN